MTQFASRSIAMIGAAAAMVTLLAGCAGAATPAASSSPSAPTTGSPTPTATPAAALAPTPRFDLTCDDLLPQADLRRVLGRTVTALDAATATSAREEFRGIAQQYIARTDGGLACGWSANGTGDGQTASLTVYPDGAARWKWFKAYYGYTTDSPHEYCADNDGTCYLTAYTNGLYVEVTLVHVTVKLGAENSDGLRATPPAVTSVFASVLKRLDSIGTLRPAWVPPADTKTVPTAHSHLLSPAQAKKALGISATPGLTGPDGGAPLKSDIPIFGFSITSADSDSGYAYIRWLPAGGWAQRELLASPSAIAKTPLDVPGLADGDTAYVGTDSKGNRIVDLVLGGNWIELETFRITADFGVQAPRISQEKYTRTLAADIVANFAKWS